jgi:putative oxidoreductase
MTTMTIARSRTTTGILWALQLLCAAMFLFAGGSKLAGVPAMVQAFDVLGAGQWFRYVTGGIELISAILLLIPPLAIYGAAALAVTMIGAVLAHAFVLGGSAGAPIFLLAATATIAWLRWHERA